MKKKLTLQKKTLKDLTLRIREINAPKAAGGGDADCWTTTPCNGSGTQCHTCMCQENLE